MTFFDWAATDNRRGVGFVIGKMTVIRGYRITTLDGNGCFAHLWHKTVMMFFPDEKRFIDH
jgi:hypothetical protein